MRHREEIAEWALRGAVFGVFFLPLQLSVTCLLVQVLLSAEPLRGAHRRHALIAALINLPIVLGFGLVFGIICWRT